VNRCPFCGTGWTKHTDRCVGGVPPVDLKDERGLAGRVISGYSFIGRIGEGGMGTVYLALDNITEGQLDAIKVLHRDHMVDRERMRREAVTANQVNHPNVCKIYNYVETYDPEAEESLTLIAMELVRGPTLREIQQQAGGVLGLDRATRVVKEVSEALRAVHARGIVHRDIKPTNIIVTHEPDGTERIKLVDFGIAKKQEGGEGQDLTEAGYVAATVHYASPEHLKGKAESRSDIYSLGVVLFELLTGTRPFEATNQAELYSLILDPGVSVPSLEQVRPDLDLPGALQPILDRALARDPEQRFSTAPDFAEAVGRIVPDLAKTVVSPIADLCGPPPLPTVPSQKAGGRGERRGDGREKERGGPTPKESSPLLKIGGPIAAVALAIVLFVGFGGWGAVSGLFRNAENTGDSSDSSRDEGDTITVPGPSVPDQVVLEGTSFTLDPEDSVQLQVNVLNSAGIPLAGHTVTWDSDPESVAEVDQHGWVKARSQGPAIVTASVGTLIDSARIQVRQRQTTPADPPDTPTDPPPDTSPGPEPEAAVCPNPQGFLSVLQNNAENIEDRSVLWARVDSAQACWARGEELSGDDRGLAAYTIGFLTFFAESRTCTDSVRDWLERAIQHGSGDTLRVGIYRERYQYFCGGDPP